MNIVTLMLVVVTGYLTWKITVNIERRRIAEKMFTKARQFLEDGRPNAAYETLHFMRWDLVDKKWFEKFLDTNKTITREAFLELNKLALFEVTHNHTKLFFEENSMQERLSDEELARRVDRIWELTELPEGYDREKVVNAITDEFKTLLEKT